MKKILFILGTRPEAIKLAPIIFKFLQNKKFKVITCSTGQHKEMLEQVLDFFKLKIDYNLELMSRNQDLIKLIRKMLISIQKVVLKCNPDYIVVQGDTTTALVGSWVGFLCNKKVIHVEAGLRSHNKYSPFPEEINRRIISILSDVHFTPTELASRNLKKENIFDNVYKVGNSVIDALHLGLSLINKHNETTLLKKFNFLNFTKKVILITGHRRESFGEPFENICTAIRIIAEKYHDLVQIVYPVHLNPNVQKPVKKILGNLSNVYLISPLIYKEFIWLMSKSYFVMTDSGGVQEEAPALGKPVIVLREVTERNEGIIVGNAFLVGTNVEKIVEAVISLIEDSELYNKMSKVNNPYGNGKTAQKIFEIISRL